MPMSKNQRRKYVRRLENTVRGQAMALVEQEMEILALQSHLARERKLYKALYEKYIKVVPIEHGGDSYTKTVGGIYYLIGEQK